MTLRELSQLYWLNREIENERERLQQLEGRAYAVGAAPADGMPRTSEVGRKTERYAVAIASIQQTIESNLIRCQEERAKLEQYIAGIDDSLTREIYRLRFISGLPWAQVAASIGGGNTAESVKKACYRHLRKHP